MAAIPLIFTSGWASGINAYAVVLLLGVLGRFGHMAAVPPALERSDVLIVAALLFVCELVVDKIPFLDSAWDLVHTAVRPVLGGAIGILMAHHAHGSLSLAVGGATVGSSTALVTHLVKAGVRMGINTSPEPVTNIVVSLLEDLTVAGMVVFALLHPVLAAALATVLLLAGLLLVAFLASRIRQAWRNRSTWRNRLAERSRPRPAEGVARPAPTAPAAADWRYAGRSDSWGDGQGNSAKHDWG